MAIGDTKKDVKLGKTRFENIKNTDDNFASLFDTVDDLNTAIDGKEPKFTKNTAFNVNFNDIDGNLSMDGERFAGTLNSVARADHRHPTDTSRLAAKPDGSNLLIESNKINTAYLPDSILGQLYYKGVWAPSSGGTSPTSPDAATTSPQKGDYYIAGDSGNYNPEKNTVSGVSYSTGDWAVYNGNSWDKVDNTDAVTMVNGQIGAVKTYKGTYSDDVTYYNGDIVLSEDCLYLCIIASGTSTGVAPIDTTNWKIFGKIYDSLKNPFGLRLMLNGSNYDYDGSESLIVEITPAAIGAATSGHTHNAATTSSSGFLSSTDKSKLDGIAAGAQVNQKAFSQFTVGTTEIKADTATDILTLVAGDNVTLTPDATNDKITIAAKDTTYTSLPNPNGLRVQVNGEGASEIRYDGSEAKTINFVAGDNVTLTQDTANNKVTIAAKDTTYTAGTGLSLSGTTFNHSNSVTAGTAQGDASKTLTFGGTFTVPTVTYDAQGHVTGKGTTTMTMPANPNTDTKVTQTLTNSSASYPLLLAPAAQTTTTTTTACFASGVTLQPNTKTIAANISGNAGTASKWATARNINGMLVQGDANRVNYGTCSTAAATAAKVVDCTGFELVTGAEITVKFTVTNSATQPTLNVNGTGAQTIYYRGNYISPSYLAANRTYTFRYSGTGYDLVGDLDTDTNSDTKVSQTLVSDNASYPLLLAPSGQTATTTTTARFDSGVTLNPSTNTIAANVSGSAAKVTNALTVQANGTSLYTYDGSAAKTINIKAGSNVTITSDSSGNITISSTTSATGDVGTVVYEASSGGLYCDGSTANTTANSKAIEDSSFKYKRLRFYCQGYYGLVCVDMPLDREHPTYATGGETGKHYGGVIFPTAENSNIDSTGIGASNHMYYELKWRVTKESAGWRVRVVDSGWLGLNAGKTSDANYTSNASTADVGTGYVSWNQRHNNQYCIYKIVAYTD